MTLLPDARIIAASAVLMLTSTSPRAEPVYAWCAVSPSGGLGQPLCHFATREQCIAFLNGVNGSCGPNPRAISPAQKIDPSARRR